MGAGYGLLQGLTNAVTGIGQGQEKGRAQVDAMRARALQDSLLKAQVANYGSEIAQRNAPQKGEWTAHTRGDGSSYKLNSANGEIVETGAATKQPKTQLVVGPDGKVYRVALEGPTGEVTGVHGKGTTNKADTSSASFKAAAGSLIDAAKTANDIELSSNDAAVTPMWSTIGGGIMGKLAGKEAGSATAHMLLNSNQQARDQAANTFTHNYAATLPRSRVSPQLVDMLKTTFFAPAGVSDPKVLKQYRDKRNEAATRLARAANGESVDLSDLPGFEENEAGAEQTVTAPSGSVGVPDKYAKFRTPK